LIEFTKVGLRKEGEKEKAHGAGSLNKEKRVRHCNHLFSFFVTITSRRAGRTRILEEKTKRREERENGEMSKRKKAKGEGGIFLKQPLSCRHGPGPWNSSLPNAQKKKKKKKRGQRKKVSLRLEKGRRGRGTDQASGEGEKDLRTRACSTYGLR